jgi:deazaflavin-dependent oxidoreductase (nitroreductase family)
MGARTVVDSSCRPSAGASEDDMASMAQRFWKAGNAVAVWMYRRTGGKVGGRAKGGSRVLLLTVAGRKSGMAHTVPVAYALRDGAYYLAATAGGQPTEPQWVRNLRAAPTATVEVGRERKAVSVEVLAGAESEAAWKDVIVATYPSFALYEAKSGRKIAVARLTPTA